MADLLAVRQSLGQDPPGVLTMVSGYIAFALAAAVFLQRAHAVVAREREITRLRAELTAGDVAAAERLAATETERDEAIGQWRAWATRAVAAETERDQGPPQPRRRCRPTARTTT